LFLSDRIAKAAPIKVLARSSGSGSGSGSGSSSSSSSNSNSIELDDSSNDILTTATSTLSTTLSSNFQDSIDIPSMDKFIRDCGKLQKLDELLLKLRSEGHRVLLYNQMTRMIDLLEEYLQHRGYSYLRLDGSTNIGVRRDLVNAWQGDESIFVFLLSTRAGGLGINLTAADTVIFYDSDWNPTVDQQAQDRAHRLGQLKQVTVYRLITKGTIEERIQQRARQKDEIHKVVIAGGSFGTSISDDNSTRASASASGHQDEKVDLISLLLEEE
jgi:SNF2 family DNA or RNA helicase